MSIIEPQKLFDLSNKVAVITGSARGLGRVLAQGIAAAGARVVVCDCDVEGAKNVAAEINASAFHAAATGVDVTNRTDCEDLMSFAIKTFGALDILINNAGIDTIGPIQTVTADDWSRV